MSSNCSRYTVAADTTAPLELAALHLSLSPGTNLSIHLDFIDQSALAIALLRGAGFSIISAEHLPRYQVRREQSLADSVAENMSLLICGLNPSPASADSGVGFHRPGNRFWPAAIAAGLLSEDRDPTHALEHHGVGMTDIVKRTTSKASEISREEFRLGVERLEVLVGWLKPRAICFVGLSGWRLAVDPKAIAGWQLQPLGETPVYLMASTSGLNASSSLDDLTAHLRIANGAIPGRATDRSG